MYRFTPSEVDRKRAHHQAVKQGADDVSMKRIGNLGEIAFEQFCREYLPVEMWSWKNEKAIRYCNPESFSAFDFEVFGHEIDVKTSRDVSAFLPEALLETDSEDDIVVMAWHRDNEDSLILLGWERIETLQSKVQAERDYSGEKPEKLDHLAVRPMNELIDLGPNTAHMNQKPQNPFVPGDRVTRAGDNDDSVAVVVDVLPPEEKVDVYGQEMDDEAVRVAFPSSFDDGPGDWRDIHPALFASYCDDQDIKLYDYKHTNLQVAKNPFVPGDRVIKPDHEEPDVAVVVQSGDDEVSVVFLNQLDDKDMSPAKLADYCEANGISQYAYPVSDLDFANSS